MTTCHILTCIAYAMILAIVITLNVVTPSNGETCPCVDAPLEYNLTLHDELPLVICIQRRGVTQAEEISIINILSQHTILFLTPSGSVRGETTSCSIIVNLSLDAANERILCPGVCQPIPEVTIRKNLLLDGFSAEAEALTCSLTSNMLTRQSVR